MVDDHAHLETAPDPVTSRGQGVDPGPETRLAATAERPEDGERIVVEALHDERGQVQRLLDRVAAELATPERVVAFIKALVSRNQLDGFRDWLDFMEILYTRSSFDDPAKVEKLAACSRRYGLSQWMSLKSRHLSTLTRADLVTWWAFFSKMASVRGFSIGTIDAKGQETDLWKATANLARAMEANPKRYAYLPPYLINDPRKVEEILKVIQDPIAFVEVLIGEAWGDIKKSADFLTAFVSPELAPDEDRTLEEAAIATVMIALQQ